MTRWSRTPCLHLMALLLVALAGCTEPAKTGASAPALQGRLRDFAWLEGSWAAVDAQGTLTREVWTATADGALAGRNEVEADGAVRFWETLAIGVNPAGEVVYAASPLGRTPPTPFTLVETGAHRAVFENPEHDFPSRIIYERSGETLHMRIEGTQEGVPAAQHWRLERVDTQSTS